MTPQQPRVLVVDDEVNIRDLVQSALRMAGFETASAKTGSEAIEEVAAFAPDLVVLDVMLPDLDGFAVLRQLRDAGCTTPVIFLTARDSADDRVRGLTSGGDDYLTKPFAVAELIARVQLRLRLDEDDASGDLRCGDLVLNVDAHEVKRGSTPIHLSPTEFKLLYYLLINADRVLSRPQIIDQVWPYDFDGDWSVVDTYISYLRRKIDQGQPKLIHTIRGVGFCLRVKL